MFSEKFEKNFLILESPYNIGICTNIAHTNSLHPPTLSDHPLIQPYTEVHVGTHFTRPSDSRRLRFRCCKIYLSNEQYFMIY